MKKIGRILIKIVIGGLLVLISLYGLYHLSYYTDFRFDPTQDQLYGKWELVRHVRTVSHNRRTHQTVSYPSHESWSEGNFIQFNNDGTFIAQDFWMPEYIVTGTWMLSTPMLYLTPDEMYANVTPFIVRRGLRLHTNGDIPHVPHRTLTAYYGDTFLRVTHQKDDSSATYWDFFVKIE